MKEGRWMSNIVSVYMRIVVALSGNVKLRTTWEVTGGWSIYIYCKGPVTVSWRVKVRNSRNTTSIHRKNILLVAFWPTGPKLASDKTHKTTQNKGLFVGSPSEMGKENGIIMAILLGINPLRKRKGILSAQGPGCLHEEVRTPDGRKGRLRLLCRGRGDPMNQTEHTNTQENVGHLKQNKHRSQSPMNQTTKTKQNNNKARGTPTNINKTGNNNQRRGSREISRPPL